MSKKYRTSEEFKRAVKDFQGQTGKALYEIAFGGKTHPSNLSHALNDTRLFLPDDSMIKRIAKVIDFKGECFECETVAK